MESNYRDGPVGHKTFFSKHVGISKPEKHTKKVRIVLSQEVNTGPKFKQTTSIIISTGFSFLLYSNVVTYVRLYGS